MTVWSFSQLKQLWIDNGGNPQFAPMAAAVALAESGGNDQSVSPMNSNGTHDYGLWQISLKGGNGGMLDPQTNVKRAISMSNNGSNWKPWCTAYNDGACGTKGGSYLGSSSPFYKYLKGTGGVVPTGPAFNSPNSVAPPVVQASNKNDCIISLPSLGPIGGGCLVTRSQGRAVIGAGILVMSGGILLVGTALLISKATGSSLPKMSLMAAAPEAAPAIEAADRPKPKMPKPVSYDANGTEITPSDANKNPGKRKAYRQQQAAKHPPTPAVDSLGNTF